MAQDKEKEKTYGGYITTAPLQSAWSGTTAVDSYEDYLRNKNNTFYDLYTEQTKFYDQQNQKALQSINAQHQQAYQNADIERERGVVDARSSYEQNKATYGANAEALARMGLTGGGYSDYLNSKAYAQQRAETQAANAQATATKREADYIKDQSTLAAEKEYSQNMLDAATSYRENVLNNDAAIGQYREQKAANEQNYLLQLLGLAGSGTYSAETIKALAKNLNLNASYGETLSGAASYADQLKREAETEKEAATQKGIYQNLYTEVLGGNLKAEAIDATAAALGLTDTSYIEQLKGLAESTNKTVEETENKALIEQSGLNAQTIYDGMAAGDVDTYTDTYLDIAVNNKQLTTDDVAQIKQWRATESVKLVEKAISGGDVATADALLEQYKKNNYIDEDTYQSLNMDKYVKYVDTQTIESTDDLDALNKDLAAAVKSGKLTEADKTAIYNYTMAKSAKVLELSGYKTIRGANTDDIAYVVIDDKKYAASTSAKKVDNALNEILTGLSKQNGGNHRLVAFGGNVYIYNYEKGLYGQSGHWEKVNNKKLVEAFKKAAEKQANVTPPTHTSKTVYNGGSIYANSGIINTLN